MPRQRKLQLGILEHVPGDNLETVRTIYDTGRDGYPATALAVIDPAVEVVYLGVVPELHGRSFHGHEGIVQVLSTIGEPFDELQIELEELIPVGDKVVVIVHQRARGRSSGVWTERRVGQVWTIRDGTAVRWEIFRDRDEALAAAGAEPAG